jgi:hypothetical protein
MSDTRTALVEAARNRIDAPFRHHYKPENPCDYGAYTAVACMEAGLDDRGYDCSGFIIASLCETLEIAVSDWPREYRHVRQLEVFAEDIPPVEGDAVVFRAHHGRPDAAHIGIHVTDHTVLHASGVAKKVVEGSAKAHFGRVAVISLPRLVELVS